MTDFHHPCKETCSGWKQGYGQGRADCAKHFMEASAARVKDRIQKLEERGIDLKIELDQLKPEFWGSTNTKIRRFRSSKSYGTKQVYKNAERHDAIGAAILIGIVCLGFGFAIGVMIGRTQ